MSQTCYMVFTVSYARMTGAVGEGGPAHLDDTLIGVLQPRLRTGSPWLLDHCDEEVGREVQWVRGYSTCTLTLSSLLGGGSVTIGDPVPMVFDSCPLLFQSNMEDD